MKRTTFLALILTLVVTLVLPAGAFAQSVAASQTWTSSIYYFNPDTDPDGGSLSVTYYGSDGVARGTSPTIHVDPKASGEVFIGDIGLSSPFRGSAVLSSDVPVLAVYEQAPSGDDPNYARMLYTAFDISQGGSRLYIPTFVYNVGGYSTQVGVQNISTGVATVTLHFVEQDGDEAATHTPAGIQASSSFVFTGEDIPGLPSGFDGSLWVEAGTGTIAAAAEELQNNGRRAYAFEGISSVDDSVFMPSMMCRFNPGGQTTFYAIQNAGSQAASVKVDVYNDATKKLLTSYTLPGTIPPGAKYSLNLCNVSGTAYKGGSARVYSTNGQNLAVVGKVVASNGLLTSFSGRTEGNTSVVLPYVLWTSNPIKGYRSYISIMNVGSQPATNVAATFYRPDGSVSKTVALASATKPLAPNIKVSTNPYTAKAIRSDGSFRGAVEISSDQPVVVIIRMERKLSGVKGYTLFGEDYIGVPPVQ